MITDDLKTAIITAIGIARKEIHWKLGKDAQHLNKRIRLRHLPPNTSVSDYEKIVLTVLNETNAELYLFQRQDTVYPTIVASIEGKRWLAMIGRCDRDSLSAN